MTDNENIEKLTDSELGAVSGGEYDNYDTIYVQPGVTFQQIAGYYHVGIEWLGNLNNIYPPYFIRIGQPILVPKKR